MKKYCDACGKMSSFNASYCSSCGLELSGRSFSKTKFFETAEHLAISGAIIALIGGIINIIISLHYNALYGFNPVITSIFVTSFFGIAAFFFSILGIAMMIKRRMKMN